MGISLDELGLTQEDVQNRIIDQAVRQLLLSERVDQDEDGRSSVYEMHSPFADELHKLIRERICADVRAIADREVLPKITERIQSVVLERTNQWGEKTGERAMSFVEYLVQQADKYIVEEVDRDGKSKNESSSYSWTKSTTRITYMINRYLRYSIEEFTKKALTDANASIAKGIENAVKMKLEEILASLKVSAQFK